MNIGNDLDEVLVQCVVDIKVFCGTLLPEVFTADFSVLHDTIFQLINSGAKHIAIAAPRGIGKTSIAKAFIMRAILFDMAKFIVYLSNSSTSAEMQTENIKRDLLSNDDFRKLFGNIRTSDKAGGNIGETFSKLSWVAYGRSFVLPRGAGQQIRGLNWNNHRPDLVVIDDLENKNEIRSSENRSKLKDWFWSDVMKTEGKYGDGCTFIYIDTIKHEASLLSDLLASPDWASVQLAICDSNYKSFDTNFMTDEEIEAEVEEHRRLGTLDAFYMERMNIPISQEDAVFKQEYFRYFDDCGSSLKVYEKDGSITTISTSNLLHITIVDPAKTAKVHSAETSVITFAVDRTSRKIFYREIYSGKLYPDGIYDEMFRQVKLFNSFILGYEATGLNEFIIQPIESEARVRNCHAILVALQARKGIGESGKIARIRTLAPNYRMGYMYHNKANCGNLEGQLLSFPKSKLWDIMDGAAYITFLMDKYAVYFDPISEHDATIIEDEYLELQDSDEPALTEDAMGLMF